MLLLFGAIAVAAQTPGPPKPPPGICHNPKCAMMMGQHPMNHATHYNSACGPGPNNGLCNQLFCF